MKLRLLTTGLLALILQVSCGAAHAVTWFDSSVRPDGVGDTGYNANNSNGQTYVAPTEEGGTIVYGGQDGEAVSDVFDSGD